MRAESRLSVRSDRERFEVEISLDVFDGDELVAHREWSPTFPRR